ncbi:hypothetical protein M885DRAFT_615009 [Pelagophyceae sp. CCMP2097]|nr:hypothetical protein M885DRAFT_615009 [Pelagophyceae sp. CCMP2097]
MEDEKSAFPEPEGAAEAGLTEERKKVEAEPDDEKEDYSPAFIATSVCLALCTLGAICLAIAAYVYLPGDSPRIHVMDINWETGRMRYKLRNQRNYQHRYRRLRLDIYMKDTARSDDDFFPYDAGASRIYLGRARHSGSFTLDSRIANKKVHGRFYRIDAAALALAQRVCDREGNVRVRAQGYGKVKDNGRGKLHFHTPLAKGWRAINCANQSLANLTKFIQ